MLTDQQVKAARKNEVNYKGRDPTEGYPETQQPGHVNGQSEDHNAGDMSDDTAAYWVENFKGADPQQIKEGEEKRGYFGMGLRVKLSEYQVLFNDNINNEAVKNNARGPRAVDGTLGAWIHSIRTKEHKAVYDPSTPQGAAAASAHKIDESTDGSAAETKQVGGAFQRFVDVLNREIRAGMTEVLFAVDGTGDGWSTFSSKDPETMKKAYKQYDNAEDGGIQETFDARATLDLRKYGDTYTEKKGEMFTYESIPSEKNPDGDHLGSKATEVTLEEMLEEVDSTQRDHSGEFGMALRVVFPEYKAGKKRNYKTMWPLIQEKKADGNIARDEQGERNEALADWITYIKQQKQETKMKLDNVLTWMFESGYKDALVVVEPSGDTFTAFASKSEDDTKNDNVLDIWIAYGTSKDGGQQREEDSGVGGDARVRLNFTRGVKMYK